MKKVFIKHWEFIFFTIALGFFSGFGQTYCLALFNTSISKVFNLSISEIASIYGFATLAASMFLPISGSLIDKKSIKTLILIVSIGVLLSFFSLSISTSVVGLFLSYMFIRLLGQSTLPMIGDTAISKSFGRNRGKILGFKNIGKSLGEGTISLLVLFFLANWGFSGATKAVGLSFILILVPITFYFLRNFKAEIFYHENVVVSEIRQNKTYKEVLKDYKLYMLLVGNVALGFILTGIFFHYNFLINFKGWEESLWASSFVFYSLTQLIFTFLTGFLVDKFGSFRIFSYKYLPLIIAMFIFITWDSTFSCIIMFCFIGMSVGMANATGGPLMAELFGDEFLGRVSGVGASIVVISTAIAPSLFAYLYEFIGVELTSWIIIAFLSFSTLLLFLSIHLYKKVEKA